MPTAMMMITSAAPAAAPAMTTTFGLLDESPEVEVEVSSPVSGTVTLEMVVSYGWALFVKPRPT